MITTADLSSYGSSVLEAIEEFMDALSVDCYLNRPDQEIVPSNEPAVAKGLVQGTKCHSLVSAKPCQWCYAAQAVRSGKWDPGLFCDEMYKRSLNWAFLIVSTGRRPERKLATYRSCM